MLTPTIISRLSSVVLLVLLVSCRQGSYAVDQADLDILALPVLQSKTKSQSSSERAVVLPSAADFVSEKVAQNLLAQLGNWSKESQEFAMGLRECAAVTAFAKTRQPASCENEFSGQLDAACLIKHGVGQKAIGQELMADRFDLNGDGLPDYVISDRYYCDAISANQTKVFFVMHAEKSGVYKLAYADWSMRDLSVVRDPKTQKTHILEIGEHPGYTYSRILQFDGNRYRVSKCIFKSEKGLENCTEKHNS